MKRKTRRILTVFIALMLVLQACAFPGSGTDDELSPEEMAQTIVAQTAAAGGSADGGDGTNGEGPAPESPTQTTAPLPTATETQVSTATLTATITLTPTLSTPMVSVSVDTNCRIGPGEIYDYIGALLVGEQAEVVGQSMDGQYWIIKNPDASGECWLWGNYATVAGPVAALPKYTPPPTPTPTFAWEGNWTTFTGNIGGPFDSDPLSITVNDKTMTGTVSLPGGDTVTLNGTISDDYLSVTGNWTGPGPSGTFTWYALGVNQFQGKAFDGLDNFAWCGSRNGAGTPIPCYKD
jgi:hypothetical protein